MYFFVIIHTIQQSLINDRISETQIQSTFYNQSFVVYA